MRSSMTHHLGSAPMAECLTTARPKPVRPSTRSLRSLAQDEDFLCLSVAITPPHPEQGPKARVEGRTIWVQLEPLRLLRNEPNSTLSGTIERSSRSKTNSTNQ